MNILRKLNKNNYELIISRTFERSIKQYKNNHQILHKIQIVFHKLSEDPYQQSLRTHQVNVSSIGKINSSSVTHSVRILWKLKDKKIILLLRIGNHDDVYR